MIGHKWIYIWTFGYVTGITIRRILSVIDISLVNIILNVYSIIGAFTILSVALTLEASNEDVSCSEVHVFSH